MFKLLRNLVYCGIMKIKAGGSTKEIVEAAPKFVEGKIVKHTEASACPDVLSVKKRKKQLRYAMMIAYQGKNYFGMQIQKDMPTIESNLLSSMVKNNLITQAEADKPFSFYFQRAARTDRAVSAVRQVCSMQLWSIEEPLGTISNALNSYLPEDIRVIGIRRTTKTFHAQKDCDSRTYSYTLPTFAFAKTDELTTASFRISKETLNDVGSVLQLFIGTHNFYNYTSRREYDDKSCFRYIISFECGEPFLFHDTALNCEMEFVTITIRGQSFMLHQIRKMIGVVISIIRELMYKSDIQRSFEGIRMDIPRAPGLGLLLEKLHYQRYDKKFGKTHEKLDDWGEEIENTVLQLRQRLIMDEILQQECASQSMMMWLSDLIQHNFVVLPESDNETGKSSLGLAVGILHAINAASNVNSLNEQNMNETEIEKEEFESSAERKSTVSL